MVKGWRSEGEGLFDGFGKIVWKKFIFAFLIGLMVVSVAIIGGWSPGGTIFAKLLLLLIASAIFYFTITKYVDVMVAYVLIIFTYVVTTAILYVVDFLPDGGSLGLITNAIAIASAIILARDGLNKADIFTFLLVILGLIVLTMTGVLDSMDSQVGGFI